MRLRTFVLTLAILCQGLSSVARAQLGDGECLVPLDAGQFKDFLTDEVGFLESDLVDFAIAAPLMSVSPVADGVLSPNEYANACRFTYAENENPGQSWPQLDNLNDGDADLTATIHFAHTDEFLFVAFEVYDDYLDLDYPANSFQNDGVEIFFNPDLDLGDDWGPGKFQVYVDAAGDGEIEFNNRGVTGGGPTPRVLADPSDPPVTGEFYSAGLVMANGNGYIVEFQFPLGSLDTAGGDEGEPVPLQTGGFVLVNMAIDDNDEDDDPSQQTGHHVLWHFDGAGSPWGGGEAIWPVPLQLTPEVTGGPDGDVNGDGVVNGADIDALSAAIRAGNMDGVYDVNGDGAVNGGDRGFMVVDLLNTYFGDANLDGEFNSSDFVTVFTFGQYEDATAGNSSWGTGDWNGDGDFDSSDFVTAFQEGGYELGPRAAVSAVPEPAGVTLLLLGMLGFAGARRRR
jgi:hypothetical protein